MEEILLKRAQQLLPDVEKGDDFFNMVIKPMADLYDAADEEFKKNKVEYIVQNYMIMDFDTLCSIAKNDFFLVENFAVMEDNFTTRSYIIEKIRNQRSLDNLSKSGLKAYYEGLGYENVRVKYNKDASKLEVYGDLKAGTESKTITSSVINSKASLGLKNGEEVVSVEKVSAYTSTGNEVVLFSMDSITETIKSYFNSENISADLMSFINSVASEFITLDDSGNVKLTSPAMSINIIDPSQVSNYEEVVKGSETLKKDIDDIEMLSAMAVTIISKINGKISEINDKIDGINYSSTSLKNFVNGKYTELMQAIIPKLDVLTTTVGQANDTLVEYANQVNSAVEILDGVAEAAESLPAEESVTEFINNIQKLNSSLTEVIR